MKIITLAFVSIGLLLQTPDATLPPASAHLAVTAEGLGVQIYHCMPKPDGTFQWVFQEPQATLFDPATHQPVGKHSAGPTWTWNDGSAITGKVIQQTPAKDAANVPWLLLEAHSNGTPGVLANVAFVRRSNTQAGAAPDYGCDAARADSTISVPYEATYTFYTAGQ